jgi:hypothetical protein
LAPLMRVVIEALGLRIELGRAEVKIVERVGDQALEVGTEAHALATLKRSADRRAAQVAEHAEFAARLEAAERVAAERMNQLVDLSVKLAEQRDQINAMRLDRVQRN